MDFRISFSMPAGGGVVLKLASPALVTILWSGAVIASALFHDDCSSEPADPLALYARIGPDLGDAIP